jgi:sulfite exporter TauE/SafE
VDWLAGPDHEQAKSLVVSLSLAYIPIGIAIVASQFVLGLGSLSDSVLFMLVTGLGTIVLTTAASDAKSFISILQLVAWILAGVLVVQALWMIRKIAHEEAQM